MHSVVFFIATPRRQLIMLTTCTRCRFMTQQRVKLYPKHLHSYPFPALGKIQSTWTQTETLQTGSASLRHTTEANEALWDRLFLVWRYLTVQAEKVGINLSDVCFCVRDDFPDVPARTRTSEHSLSCAQERLAFSDQVRQTPREKYEKLTRRRRFLAGCPVTSEHPSPFFASWRAAVESWQQIIFQFNKLYQEILNVAYIFTQTQAHRSPFCTTRFLHVLQQEQAWLHSKMKGGSSEQNSGNRRLSWEQTRRVSESGASNHVRHTTSWVGNGN